MGIHSPAHSESSWQPTDLTRDTCLGLPHDVAAGFLRGYEDRSHGLLDLICVDISSLLLYSVH